jgi:hypothetical protein
LSLTFFPATPLPLFEPAVVVSNTFAAITPSRKPP